MTLACWTTAFSVLAVGCATPTPDLIEMPFTVVVTPTPVEETIALAQTPRVFPTAPAPPALTPEASTTVPASVTSLPTVTPVPPSEPYDDRGDPVRLLASYYNAIDRKEYRRAWEYWETPPNPSYEEFVQGYAETASVLLVVRLPVRVEGAAGSVYAGIPTLLIATHTDGSRHAFVGCYVGRRVNPGTGGVDERWSLYDAAIDATPGNTTDVILLVRACEALR